MQKVSVSFSKAVLSQWLEKCDIIHSTLSCLQKEHLFSINQQQNTTQGYTWKSKSFFLLLLWISTVYWYFSSSLSSSVSFMRTILYKHSQHAISYCKYMYKQKYMYEKYSTHRLWYIYSLYMINCYQCLNHLYGFTTPFIRLFKGNPNVSTCQEPWLFIFWPCNIQPLKPHVYTHILRYDFGNIHCHPLKYDPPHSPLFAYNHITNKYLYTQHIVNLYPF